MMARKSVFVGVAPAALHRQIPWIWTQTLSQAIGPDAEQRDAQAFQAAIHWQARPTFVLLVAESDDHVPLTPGHTIKTRYRYIGRLPARELPTSD